MKLKPYLESFRDHLVHAGRTLASASVRAARLARAGARNAWNSELRRRVTGPVLSLGRVAALAAILSFGTITLLRGSITTIEPTEIAVVQDNWGAGVVPRDRGAGRLFALPGRAVVHRLNRRTQFLRFGMKSEGNDLPSLELRSPEGLEIRASVTVPYRIAEDRGHRLVSEGRRTTYAIAARAAVERVLLEELAKLGQDDWADVDARRTVLDGAQGAIAEALEPFHLTPLGVHLTAAWFPPMYEVELQAQKLLEQRILTDEMLARLDEGQHELLVERESIARSETELSATYDFEIEQERLGLEADVIAVRQEVDAYRFERRTESNNLYRKAVAEGALAIDRAEALRERLVNEALETDGGRLLLARDAAKKLRFKSVSLDANNPAVPSVLDLDGLARLLIGDGTGDGPEGGR
ncbi:MAG: SPFH domain-containing protein [Planctomycetota bacterium]